MNVPTNASISNPAGSSFNPKQAAAEAAVALIRSGQTVGLGTGSTAAYFLRALGAAVKSGKLTGIRGIPTSIASEKLAAEVGVPLTTLSEVPKIDITVDGADEIDPSLDLIKGLGGALLREKVVAQNSARLVIIADATKRVKTLGTKGPLPVEVIQFEHACTARYLESLQCRPVLRMANSAPFVTDNGNYIYDCHFAAGIPDSRLLNMQLGLRAGVVESGLFLGIADTALIATDAGIERLTR